MIIRSSIMKAIRVSKFGGPEVLLLENVEIPCPQRKQVLIKVKAIGVNPVDTYIRTGGFPQKKADDLPYTPGSDAAGIVESVGEDVSNVKAGDRVFTCDLDFITGSYAEYMLAPSTKVFRFPERLTFSQGASIGVPYFTALRGLKYKAQVKAGETVLIHGASGAVGIAACQIASAWGLDVVGTASTPAGAEHVKSAGARLVLDHKDPQHSINLKNATNGKGFNVILEMLANVNLPLDLSIAAEDARIVIIGNRGKVEIDPRMIMLTEAIVTAVKLHKTTDAQWVEMGEELAKGFEKGWLNPVVDQEFPLENAAEAHKAVIEHSGGSKGKIVLIVN